LIGIIDYNMGNLASVFNACEKLQIKAKIESKAENLKKYDKLILPGVGAFGDAMEHLEENGLDEAIKEEAKKGKYLFGVCLGMQLLFDRSEEFGDKNGLGLINGEVKYFDKSRFNKRLKVPHMGWNKIFKKENALFDGLDDSFYLYFVHSLHIITDETNSIGESLYGYNFTSAVNSGNIFGIQPHPEKSHDVGLQILNNFNKL
jgi:glutamine amidotransferase